MKNIVLSAGAIAAGIIFYSPISTFATPPTAEIMDKMDQSEQLGMATDSENTTIVSQGEPEEIAGNSNGRRCRWVKGHGLVCDGGQFGTFTL